ncbi:beta strand repeat-containing protein, partial [Flavobacterium sp.]|uniref:beta strand repeat-containing protein n=1 Tax=Flavobacterium sp. TaxID=239 RepID=UPI0038D44E93
MKKLLLCFVLILMSIPKIYSQNLVTNGDFTAGNTGFATDYVYTVTDVSAAQGLYGITTNPNAWFVNFPNCPDHTSGTGNMMVFDGSVLGSTVRVWSQTIPVQAGKNYVFSYWVQSFDTNNPALLETFINGISAGAAVSAPTTITCGNWLKISVTWNSGASTSAIITMRDSETNATGNDFAIDDIAFATLPTATISGPTAVCKNSAGNLITFTGANGVAPYTFTYNINGGANQTISSTIGNNSVTLPIVTTASGLFNYNLVSVSYGTALVFSQNQSGTAVVNILDLPTATISGSATVCKNNTGNLITFTGANGISPYTFTYNINGGTNQTISSTIGNNSVTLPVDTTTSGLFDYNLVSVANVNAPQCSQNQSGIATVNVLDLPTATISGSGSICLNSLGNTITLTGANGIAPYTFVYNINGGPNLSVTTGLGNSVSVAVPSAPVGVFNYNLVSVSNANAPTCSQNQIGTATINVLALPTATISGDAYVCSGATGVISFSGTPNATVNYTINNGANQTVLLDGTGNASVTSAALTATAVYDLVTVNSNGTTNCSQNITGSATLSVPTATIFGSTSIAPGESAPITFYGTPGVTVNFTSTLGAGSVVLNSSGIGYYNIPYIDTTTVFSLVSATVGACLTPLSGSVTITVIPFCSIPGSSLPLAEVNIDTPQAVCNLGQCTDLLARYTQISTPTDYTVCSVPFAPTFPFTGGIVIPATGDDSWSPIVTLPFIFNFYGNCYNNVLVGTNGVITFDLLGQVPLGYCNWPFTATIPGAGFPIKNAIYGVYQDTNIASPPVTNTLIQNVNYYILDTGVNAAPNRVFVANFNELPQFSCNASVGFQTSQIVIHETTNIIDVLVSKRSSCVGWNSGSGLIGIQNQAGTLASVPPGRNTGTWGTTNEAWRFYPNAAPTPTTTELSWELNGFPIGSINENPLTVCPTVTGTYSAVVKYKRCDGTIAVVRDDVSVGVATPLPVADPQNITFCSSSLPPYTVNIDQNAAMLSTVPVADQGNYSIKYYERYDDAKNDAPNNIDYLSVADLATYQVPLVPKTIYVRIEDLVTTGCFNVRSFVIDVVSSPSGTFAYTASPYCNNDATPKSPTIFALTSGGSFTASSPNLTINATTGAIDASTSTPAIYTVTYTIPATALCPAFTTDATVEIIPCSCTITASSSSQTVCVGTAITPITYTSSTGATAGSVVVPDLPPGVTGSFSGSTFTISGTPNLAGTYTFVVTLDTGITDTCTISTTIEVKALPTATITGTTTICSGTTATITFTGTPNATVTYTVDGGANQTILLDAAGNGTVTTPILTVDSTYDLVSIASNGTPNCTQTLTGSVTITVKALPTAAITGTTTICSGTTAVITFTGTPNATVNYSVDGGTNQTILLDAAGNGTVTTPILTIDSTYDLVSVETNGTPNCTKTLTGSVTITVKALPTASISGATTICSGTTTTITFTGTAGATVTYTVNGGLNQTITLDATGNGTVTTPALTADSTYDLVSVASNGTPNCTQTLVGSVTVTVKAIPTATITGTTTICSGTTAVITFTGTADATVTYTVDGGTNQTILLDAAGNGSVTTPILTIDSTYDLVSIETGGTPNCTQTLTGSVTITVKALPTASISGTTTICSGTTAVITFTGTPNATVNYTVDGGTNQTILLDAAGNGTVTTPILTIDSTYDLVSVETNGTPNCTQTLTGSVTITVKALPTASISGATTICSGTTTTITFTGTAGATVTYTVNGGLNQTITLDAAGNGTVTTPALTADSTYDLVSVASNGTPNCTQTLVGSVTVTVKAIPTATITGTTTICSGTTATITFTGTPNAIVTYTVDGG